MAFTPIDEQTWERREYLEVFRQTAIYLTAEVDITPLYRHTKARGEKLYPALVWCVAAVLNRHAHFRYGRDEAGRIGIWDELHPYYTVPRRDAPDLFAMKVTRLTPDYDAFLSRFREEVLLPARRGETIFYRPFDCRSQTLLDAKLLPSRPLTVVEGSYSHPPKLAGGYDLKLFLTCSREEQARRLQAREGTYYQTFETCWIPAEERYLRSFDIENADVLRLDTTAFFME